MLLLCIDRCSCTTTPFHVCLFRASGVLTEKGNNLSSSQDKQVETPREIKCVSLTVVSCWLLMRIGGEMISQICVPYCAMEQTLIICISWAELKPRHIYFVKKILCKKYHWLNLIWGNKSIKHVNDSRCVSFSLSANWCFLAHKGSVRISASMSCTQLTLLLSVLHSLIHYLHLTRVIHF